MKKRSFLWLGLGAAGVFQVAAWSACTPVTRTIGGGDGGSGGQVTGSGGHNQGGGGGTGCKPGETVSCYSGPPGTSGVAECKAGTAKCGADGKPGACVGEVLPQPVTPANCTAHKDVDCNGQVDRCALDLVWANAYSADQGDNNVFQSVAFDPAGNVILTGILDGQVDFGNGAVGPTMPNDTDVFVVKLDPEGKLVWRKRYGDTARQEAYAVGTDAAGNIFFAGNYAGTMNLENLILPTVSGSEDAFLVKLDPTGKALWQRSGGDGDEQTVRTLAVAPSGGVVVAGSFWGLFSWTGGGDMLDAGNSECAFVQRFDANGNHVFTAQTRRPPNTTSSVHHVITSIAIDANDDVIVAGVYYGGLMFPGGAEATTFGDDDVFVAKLDGKTGILLWQQHFGGTGYDEAHGVAVDAAGNVYVSGAFETAMTVGGFPISTAGNTGLFLTQLNGKNGTVNWARAFGAIAGFSRMFVRVDGKGSLVLSGLFDGTVTFGGNLFDSSLVGNSSLALFLAKLDPSGTHLASRAFKNTTSGISAALGLAVAPGTDTIAIAGATMVPIDLGAGPIGQLQIANPIVATYAP